MAGSIVQSAQNFSTTAGTTKAVTLTGTTAGNAIVVFAHDGSGTSKAMTCADNVNGSYGTQVDSLNDATNGNTLRSWVKGNIAGGSVTVTVSFPASDIFIGLYAAEVTGVSTAPLDGHHAQTQSVANGAAISSGAGTNASTAFMLSLSVRDDTSSAGSLPSVGTGFTVDPTFSTGVWNYGNGNNALVEFKASVAAGSNAASFTNSSGSTGTFNTLVVMLDEASAGTQSFSYTMAGGMTFAGNPLRNYVRTQAARTGGLLFSGTATEIRVVNEGARTGGLVFSGSFQRNIGRLVNTPTGGLVFSGVSAQLRRASWSPSNGLLFGGIAGYSSSNGTISFSYTMSGGLTFAGASAELRKSSYTGTGGVHFAGTAAELRARTFVGSGGIIFSGVADEVGIHPGTGTTRFSTRRFYGAIRRGR